MRTIDNLVDLVKEIAKTFDRERVPYAVSGAVALNAYGVVRATSDIDLLISVPSIRLPSVLHHLIAMGCEGDPVDLVRQAREEYLMILPCGQITIEIFLPAIPYHENVLRRAVVVDVEGTPVRCVTAEDLIILKMLFHRLKDLGDVKSIIATLGPTLDVAYLRETLGATLPADDARHREMNDWLVDAGR